MKRHLRREDGQGLVEYALILVLVSIVVIVILALLGNTINGAFARVVAALNGQDMTGTGTEYVITSMGASASGSPPDCTVNVTGMQVTVFEDGELAGAGVAVSGSVSFSGGAGGSASGSTNSSGTATLNNVSGLGSCSGSATLTVSGNSRTVSYSN